MANEDKAAAMSYIVTPQEVQVSVLIPLHNEESILEQNLDTLAKFLDRMIGSNQWCFLLVENGSTDATPSLVKSAVERWPLSQAIILAEPNYGTALKAGVRAATTEWIYIFDIEQWDLPFIAWSWKNRNNYDALVGSKRADPTICHQDLYRRILSCGLNGLLQVFLQFTGTDTHGAKLLNRNVLWPIIRTCELDRGQYDTEIMLRAARAQKRIVEVPVLYRELRPHRNLMFKRSFGTYLH